MQGNARGVLAAVLLGLLLGPAGSAWAGEGTPPTPLAAGAAHPALDGLGARLARAGDGKPADRPPSRFASTGGRMIVGPLVDAVVQDAEARVALRSVVDAVFGAYEEAATRAGVGQDVAGALAFYLSAQYSVAHGGEDVPDAATETLVRQLQVALDVPAMRGATDAEKQQLYELFTFLSAVTLLRLQTAEEQHDAAEKAALRAAGEEGLRTVLGVEPARVTLTAKGGLSVRPAGRAAPSAPAPEIRPAAPSAPISTGLTWSAPPGWTEERKPDGSTWISRSDGDDFYGRSTCVVLVGAPGPAGPDLVGALRAAWQGTIAPAFDGPRDPFVLRRRVGTGNAAFAQEGMVLRSNGARFDVALHVLDLGAALATVAVLVQGDLTLYLDPVERLLASLRAGPPPAPRPLYAPSEILGTWSWHSRSLADFVTPAGSYAGDASIAVGETFTFEEDGTYVLQLGGVGRGKVVRADEKGTFRIDGDRLVLLRDGDAGRASRRRLLGTGTGEGGTGRVLLLLDEAYDLRPSNVRFYGQRFTKR